MDDAAAALANILDRETVLEILKARVTEKETPDIGSRTTLDNDDF